MKDLIKKILKFRDDRNWKSGHTPSNLAILMMDLLLLMEPIQLKKLLFS